MKIQVSIIAIFAVFTLKSYAQTGKIESYLDKLPKMHKTTSQSPLHYRLTIDWINRDIDGKVINHNIAFGKLTQGLQNDTINWSDVTLTEIGENTKNTKSLTELNELKYKIIGDNFTKPEFYKDFPPAQIELIRWFVQDQVAFSVYGQMYLDSLKLNVPFYPELFQNHQTKFDQYVNFNTKSLNITWTGISKINGELCTLLHYQAMYNPIDLDNDAMNLHGRSCFWGDIWVSIDTRQIEYATMSEDLIFNMKLKANNYEQRLNLQREVKLEKME